MDRSATSQSTDGSSILYWPSGPGCATSVLRNTGIAQHWSPFQEENAGVSPGKEGCAWTYWKLYTGVLFLLVGPGPSPAAPLHRPLETPGPLNRPFSADSKRRRSFHVCPACPPLLTVLCHRIQVWMDKPKNPTEDAAEAVPRPNHTWGRLLSTHGRKITPSHLC